ncbi:hypothetical protein Bca52824_082110 [Brassica carinata]|uniref:Uncharacterized protein n=1 Tax=Brassica carinata TaxID=52824 RepID=A0A8X7PGE8_BRACI|nr:hypothetical protein Bca52824_082110 [Brassica carinata]
MDDMVKKEVKEEEVENFGLRELIDGGDVARGRVLHRNINISSSSLVMMDPSSVSHRIYMVHVNWHGLNSSEQRSSERGHIPRADFRFVDNKT